jgi:insulin-like growth factor 2 mRNA-binding protein 1
MIYACCYNGLLIFATYYDCDPLSTKLAKAKDQLVPLYIIDLFRNVPGLPGLFVSGIFSAALSSLSTGLNSLSAVVLEDFVKPNIKNPLTGKQTDNVMRGVVVAVGILCVILVFIVEKMGAVLQLTYNLGGVTSGPLFGIFIMGLTMPWINNKSALIGGVSSLLITGFMAVKTQALQASGQIILPTKPVTTDGCTYDFDNSTIISPVFPESTDGKTIYHLSYMYSTMLGFLIVVVISHLSIILVGRQKPDELDPKLLSPVIRRWVQPHKDVKEHKIEMTHNFDTKHLVDNTEKDG